MTNEKTIRKAMGAQLAAGEGERSFVARITSAALDRDNEVLIPEGMISTDYEKNPVVFWNHDHDRPIGKATNLKRDAEGWTAKATLAKRPENHEGEWFPDTVLSLLQQGVIKGVSVGFMPTESRKPTPKDVEKFGDAVTRVFSKWKLLEFSVAPLQANQDALVTAVSKSLVSRETASKLFPDVEIPPVVETPTEVVVDTPADPPKAKARKRVTVTTQTKATKRRTVFIMLEPPKRPAKKKTVKPLLEKATQREVARRLGFLMVD